MTTVLDAYAIVAYLRGEPCAGEVADLLRDATILTSVNAAEVLDQMVRVFGAAPDSVDADLALLNHAGLAIIAVTHEIGVEAGRIRARRYHRDRSAVSLADCVAASAALASHCPLATSDPALAEVLRAEGGKIHPLPDSKGRRPLAGRDALQDLVDYARGEVWGGFLTLVLAARHHGPGEGEHGDLDVGVRPELAGLDAPAEH